MRLLFFLLCVLALTGRAANWQPADIHPKVFQLLDGWLSDTAAPIVTEVNLDAVRVNRNQFDYAQVRKDGNWVTYADGKQTLRFHVTKAANGRYTIVYQENGGGSLTTERVIQCQLVPRTITVHGKDTTVTVLRAIAFDDGQH